MIESTSLLKQDLQMAESCAACHIPLLVHYSRLVRHWPGLLTLARKNSNVSNLFYLECIKT